MTDATQRAEFVRGLRDLADRIERHPDAPLPYTGSSAWVSVFAHDDRELGAAARCYGGEKVVDENGLRLRSRYGWTLYVTPLYGACERVPTGRTVKQTVYDAVPREVEVEEYETRCPESLLALADQAEPEAVTA